MSINKLLTFFKHNCDRRKEDNSLLDESDKLIRFISVTTQMILSVQLVIG